MNQTFSYDIAFTEQFKNIIKTVSSKEVEKKNADSICYAWSKKWS